MSEIVCGAKELLCIVNLTLGKFGPPLGVATGVKGVYPSMLELKGGSGPR